jgi:RNA-binding protein
LEFVFSRGNESLQRIGRVFHISQNRNIIIKAEKLPRLGDKVLDENLNLVGTVFDIIGPVSSPYVTVKPRKTELQGLVGKVVYGIPSKKRKGR